MQHIIPVKIVEIENDNYHLLVSGVFSDGSPGNWVLDTGASKSVFDKTLSALYTAEETGSETEIQSAGIGEHFIETSVGEIFGLSFGTLFVETLKVALIDLSHVNSIYEKYSGVEICGLIGSDFLYKYKAVIDYQKQELCLDTDGTI